MKTTQKELYDLLSNGQLEPYVRHIRFYNFKNVAPDTRIEFTFPITALVGANGTNKSSILRAIQATPEGTNIGSFWFSTDTDPIIQVGDARPSYIYGYFQKEAKDIVEVLQTRIADKKDPDLWETSRRYKKYDMEDFKKVSTNANTSRWDKIVKSDLYIDFRQSLSAFDKYFYGSELDNEGSYRDRKDVIRKRSVYLQKAIALLQPSYVRYIERIVDGVNRKLSKSEVEAISYILGRAYTEIVWIKHRFFKRVGYTCVLRSKDLRYTEAFAGSGEFSAVRLVVEILNAPKKSLILLDEPEVSLHPGAQERLIEFLFEQVKLNKHQVVFATHSPALIRQLPPDAIKTLTLDQATGKIILPSQRALPEEAFFHIGEPVPGKRTVIVEDILAKRIVERALRKGNQAFMNLFDVKFYPSGSQSLWANYIPPYAAESRKDVLILFDGDQRRAWPPKDPDKIPSKQWKEIRDDIHAISDVKLKLNVDGGSSGKNKDQEAAAWTNLSRWVAKFVDYLPGSASPEGFIWDNMPPDSISDKIDPNLEPKDRFVELTRKSLGRKSFENVTSQEIATIQEWKLSSIPDANEGLNELYKRILAFSEQ